MLKFSYFVLSYLYHSDDALLYMQASESASNLREELGETDSNDSFHREVM